MKKIIFTSTLLILCFILAACGAQKGNSSPNAGAEQGQQEDGVLESTQAQYHKIAAEEAKARMDSGDTITIVDVRTQEEFDEAHIEGATLIPNETIGDKDPQQLEDKDAEILLYCRSGRRSKEAAEKLVALGYTAVYDFGGIIDWPYDTVSK